jgi:hypothetical protein
VRAAGRAVGGYVRWVAEKPETRLLGTAMAALCPAGEIGHLAHADPVMLGAFGPPAAAVAWVSAHKTHGSHWYSATAASLAAGVPAWLATAAATGVTDLPVLLGYTGAAAAGWSAITWSDVMKHRRLLKAQRARWETVASAAGLEGSRLVREKDTRTGQEFTVDIRGTGSSQTRLAHGDLDEKIAAVLSLPAERVRVEKDTRHAGNVIITVQMADPWEGDVSHPALDPAHAPARRSIMDGPLVLGADPDTGGDLALNAYDDEGARHTNITAATGAGKTTLYSNIIEDYTGRSDTLVWAIDLRKGTIPFLWGDALDARAGLSPDGVPEYDKALAIVEWGAEIIRQRSARSGGRNHVPTPDDPAILIIIDEGDSLLGADSPIAHKAKPPVGDILKGGRSAGVGLAFAGQRAVVQYTGTKDLHANAANKIVLRVNRSSEMNNTVPEWEEDGMPDMSTYAQGTKGVALVVGPDRTWKAGRVRDLHDFDQVMALAKRRGRPTTALPPTIAAALDGYADRREPAKAPVIQMPAPKHRWQDGPSAVARLADLAGDVADTLAGMPEAPDSPTPIADLVAVRDAINSAETNSSAVNRTIPLSERITGPILALLGDREDEGARRDEIVAHIGRPASTVKRWLAIMRDHGLIAVSGSTHQARYYLPEHAPDDVIEEAADDDIA